MAPKRKKTKNIVNNSNSCSLQSNNNCSHNGKRIKKTKLKNSNRESAVKNYMFEKIANMNNFVTSSYVNILKNFNK